jgi:putative methionine-R-sulfoxide reductase with GAF domain/HAMP domain-containing protein
MLLDTHTLTIFDDPILSPNTLAFISISPLRITGVQPDLYLVGMNSGTRIVQLMEELQVFWQRRGVYRIERGKTYLALMPDKIFELPRYATTMDVQENAEHPIFQTPKSLEADTLEYEDDSGQSMLGAYQWMPDWKMAVVVELPTSEIFSGLLQLTPFMVILILITAIVTLGVIFLVTNRMFRPITSLADFANRISHGEWLYRVPEERKDELGALAVSLNRMAEELGTLYRSLETRVEDRTRQVRTASEVARAIISIPNPDELLRQAVHLIKERFRYDHVSIFLLDAQGRYAELRERAGEIEEVFRARSHQVQVGSQTLIGWVAENNETRMITDVSEDPDYMKEEMLPGVRSEVAIPLQVGGNSLGVIDVQSMEQDAFQQEALEVLQTLADLLSSAIENARLAQESANAAERARLVSEITSQLSGILEPEQVLQSAAHALHRALGEADIVVRLVPPDEIPAPAEEGYGE